MKKFLLTPLVIISLASCTREDSMQKLSNNDNAESAERVGVVTTATSFNTYLDLDSTMLCKNAPKENIISLNPSFTYIDNFNVIARDGGVDSNNCPNNGKQCIDLSNFLGLNGAYLRPSVDVNQAQRIPIYYGSSQEYNFSQYNAGSNSYTTSFSVGDNGYSLFYGGIVTGFGTYMTNDAANTILQTFRNDIQNYLPTQNGQPAKIKAAHFIYDEWLCGDKQIKMNLKYTF